MITSDIKLAWLPIVSYIKSQCGTNSGFASINLSIPVYGADPVPVPAQANGTPGLGWLSIVRHLQAKCSKNVGLAIAQLRVVVVGDSPVLWEEAAIVPVGVTVNVNRIRPMRVKGLQTAPELVEAVSGFLPGVLDVT